MTVRINPAKLLLWRNPKDLQIGLTEPLVLTDVSAEQERLLALLERGVADDAVLPEDKPLIQRLSSVLLENAFVKKPVLSGDFVRGAFAELIRASFATNRDGIAVLEQRAKATIHLDSLGQGGALICLGLAAAGVGRILSPDERTVGEHDIGPLGYPTDALGTKRVDSLNGFLKTRPGSTVVRIFDGLTPAKQRHTLRVLIGQNALAPSSYRQLLKNKSPHIAVMFGSEWVSVSPRIVDTPCLGCLDRHRTDSDQNWPTLAAQLIGRADYLEDARSALFAASMVVGEIVRAIDSPLEEGDFLGHRLHVSSGRIEQWSWQTHSDCECAP